jgi:hypothetical protein
MDVDTIEGFVTYSVLAMQAELHSRLLSRRMTAVRAREADAGQLGQKPARGQTWADGRLVWDAATTALPVRAFALAATGMGTPDVQAQLIEEGHHIGLSSLHYLLNNPAYVGLMRHRGRLLPAVWPPLIDQATWDAVQAYRRGRHRESAVRPTVRAKAHALLSGLAYCANCGAKLHYEHHRERRHYYACSARSNGGHCDARPSRADYLDAQIEAVVGELVLSSAIIDRARALIRAAAPPPPLPVQQDTAERLRRLARAYADGAYSDEEYAAKRAAIQAAATPAPPAQAIDRSVALDQALELVGRLPELWAANATPRRRALLGQLVSQIYARRGTVYAVRPTRAAEPLFQAVWAEHDRTTCGSWSQTTSRPVLLRAA